MKLVKFIVPDLSNQNGFTESWSWSAVRRTRAAAGAAGAAGGGRGRRPGSLTRHYCQSIGRHRDTASPPPGHARLITLDAATSGHSPFLDVLQISFVGQVFAGPTPRGVVDAITVWPPAGALFSSYYSDAHANEPA